MKAGFKKAWHGFAAAVTSPTAVQKEKSLAVFVGTRVALSLGASAGVVAVVVKIIGWS
jgi:hypothetical protein